MDAVSGDWFPESRAVESVWGVVDGRNEGTLDLDGEMHEMNPDAVAGPIR